MTIKDTLITKIENRELVIGIIGIGHVGLPLAVTFAQANFETVGIDLSESKVRKLNEGQSYIGDIQSETIKSLVNARKLRASTDFDDLNDVDAIIICVPTPLSKTREPDISHIIAATEQIVMVGSTGKLIILESTTYPGTTEEIIRAALQGSA